MQQVLSPSVEIPKKGYIVSQDDKRRKIYEEESHLLKKGAFTDLKVGADRFTKAIGIYFPKAFSGSKNSNFYEYLSLGMVPYVVGSALLIALGKASNKTFNRMDGAFADKFGNRAAAGVVLYGLGKWLSKKIAHMGIHASTGVDLDLKVVQKVSEFPELGQEKGRIAVQYPGAFDSADFPRKDLISQDNELNYKNDFYHYEDKILKKAGYKKEQNAPNQTAWPLIRKLKVRTTTLENIGQYVAAATGVALGFQKSFGDIKITNPRNILVTMKNGIKELWKGTDRNLVTKNYGKALILGTIASTILTWLIPTAGFKIKPNHMKSKVDVNKRFEEA